MLDYIPHLFVKVSAVQTLQVTAVAGVSTQLQLSFPTNLNALGHEFQISTTSGVAGFSGWLPLAPDKTISGLAAATPYWVKVRAVNGLQRGAPSPVATATTNSPATLSIVQVGTTVQLDISTPSGQANSGTTAGIAVPSDAELMIFAVAGYYSVHNGYSGGSVTFTKDGVDTPMTPAVTGAGATDAGGGHSTMFWMALPDTGAGKTLKWDWAGTGNTEGVQIHTWTFWKGVDTASPIRHALAGIYGSGGSFPVTVGPLTCVTGDKIVAFCSLYSSSGEDDIATWTNLTTLTSLTRWLGVQPSDGAWATGNPTGTTTVSANASINGSNYASMTAVVLRPGIA